MQNSCSFSIFNMCKNSVSPAGITRPRSSGIQKFCSCGEVTASSVDAVSVHSEKNIVFVRIIRYNVW